MKQRVLIYGNFDVYNNRHREVLSDWKDKGYEIYVGLETDEYMGFRV